MYSRRELPPTPGSQTNIHPTEETFEAPHHLTIYFVGEKLTHWAICDTKRAVFTACVVMKTLKKQLILLGSSSNVETLWPHFDNYRGVERAAVTMCTLQSRVKLAMAKVTVRLASRLAWIGIYFLHNFPVEFLWATVQRWHFGSPNLKHLFIPRWKHACKWGYTSS